MTDHNVVGKTGRVSGAITPDAIGAVLIEIRGGTEEFFARAFNKDEEIEKGTRVVVLEVQDRTVYVEPIE